MKQITGLKDKEAVAIAVMQEVGKDRRMQEMKAERRNNNNEPATAKQIGYLKKLGMNQGTGITKIEASKLIDKAVAGR